MANSGVEGGTNLTSAVIATPRMTMQTNAVLAATAVLQPYLQSGGVWGTATSIGVDTTDSNTITTTASVPAGALIVVAVTEKNSTPTGMGTVSDNAAGGANSYSLAPNNKSTNAGSGIIWTGIFYAYNVNALASGGTITYTSQAPGSDTGGGMSAFYITGELTSSDPHDSAVDATATGNNSQPSVTSGTPGVSGELFVGVVGQVDTNGGLTFSQASGWSTPPDQGYDGAATQVAGGNLINGGTGTETYNPTLTVTATTGWVACVTGFQLGTATQSLFPWVGRRATGTLAANATLDVQVLGLLATATLAAGTTLTALWTAGGPTAWQATATLAANTTLDVQVLGLLATATLAANTTLSATTSIGLTANATLAANTTLSATPFFGLTANATLAAGATLTATPRQTMQTTATLAAATTLSALPSMTLAAVATLAAGASLIATPQMTMRTSATLAANTTLTALPFLAFTANATLAASTTLIATTLQTMQARATLAAGTTLSALASLGLTANATLAAGTSLIATPLQTMQVTATLAAGTTLIATTLQTMQVSAVLAANTTLTAVSGSATAWQATATLSANTTMTALPFFGLTANATLAANTTLTAAMLQTMQIAATLAATTTLSALPFSALRANATLAAGAALIATPLQTMQVSATLAGSSTLIATPSLGLVATATLAASTTLTATPRMTMQVAATLPASTTLIATARQTMQVSAVLAANTTFIILPITAWNATATLAASTTLTALWSGVVWQASATLAATTTLSAAPNMAMMATAVLAARTTLSAFATQVRPTLPRLVSQPTQILVVAIPDAFFGVTSIGSTGGSVLLVNEPVNMVFDMGLFIPSTAKISINLIAPDGSHRKGNIARAFTAPIPFTYLTFLPFQPFQYIVYAFAPQELDQTGTWQVSVTVDAVTSGIRFFEVTAGEAEDVGGIQQSGAVTPGHLSVFTTDGVVQDGGAIPVGQRVLGTLRGADFNTAADQPILMPAMTTSFQITGIIVTNASVALTSAAGGFYTQPNKSGSQIVANTQVYSTLTGSDLLMQATLTAFAQSARFSQDNLGLLLNANNQNCLALYLSLTTPEGHAATADVFIVGVDLT